MTAIDIRPLNASAPTVAMLSDLLVETVANGGSVSFMHPLDRAEASRFWIDALASAARGERVILGAFNVAAVDGTVPHQDLVGTVSLILDCPPNQPHRAEIAKMMTRPSHRGRGIATRLLQAAEALAAERGRWLLVLDTASDGGASGLYERLGYALVGEIPDYALKPHGGLTGTKLYWKRLGRPFGTAL